MLQSVICPSPNKKHKATLTYLGEIPTNHDYYSLFIGGFPHSFENRIFGRSCMWSLESRFLAAQEWKEINKDSPPKFYLLMIIDILTRRECLIANVEGAKGIILPEGFIGESLMYAVIYYGPFGITKNFESRFQYLDGWQNIK